MRLKMKITFLAALVALVLGSVLVRAEETAKPIPPVQIGVTSVKSADAVIGFLKELGVDPGLGIISGMVENALPMLTGLQMDKPVGVIMFVGADFGQDKGMVFVIPRKPIGNVGPGLVKDAGASPVDGHPGLMMLNGMVYRRTENHLIVGFRPDTVEAADPDVVVNNITAPQTLLRSKADMKALHALPREIRAKIDENFAKQANAGQDPAIAGIMMAVAKFQYDSYDLNDWTVDQVAEGLRIRDLVSPLAVPPLAEGDRPQMPEGIFARVDIAVSLAQLFGPFKEMAPHIVDALAEKKPENKKQLQSLVDRAAALVLDPTAISFGFEIVDTKPVIYVVQHQSKPADVPTEVWSVLSGFTDALGIKGDEVPFDHQTYDLDGRKMMRVVVKDHGKESSYFDFAQRGNDVYVAWSETTAHPIQRLLAGGKSEPTKGPLSGWIDLGKLTEHLSILLPPQVSIKVLETFHGEKVNVLTVREGAGIKTELLISQALLKKIPSLVRAMNEQRKPGL